jgi:hypothetical protein
MPITFLTVAPPLFRAAECLQLSISSVPPVVGVWGFCG